MFASPVLKEQSDCRKKSFKSNYASTSVDSEFSFVSNVHENKYDGFIVDSGSTSVMINDSKYFTNLHESYYGDVSTANSSLSRIEGKGSISFCATENANGKHIFEIDDVLYVPSYSYNLMSVSKLTDLNMKLLFTSSENFITSGSHDFPLRKKNNLYLWDISYVNNVQCNVSMDLFHLRMGHNNFHDLNKLNDVYKLSISQCDKKVCEVCQTQKSKRNAVSRICHTRATSKLHSLRCFRTY